MGTPATKRSFGRGNRNELDENHSGRTVHVPAVQRGGRAWLPAGAAGVQHHVPEGNQTGGGSFCREEGCPHHEAYPVSAVSGAACLLGNQRAFYRDDRILEPVLGGLCGNDHGEPFRFHHPRLLAAAEGQILHQRRGALQGLGTPGVAEDAGHPGARTVVDADHLSHRRAGSGGTEYAVLTEDVQ